MISHGTGQLSVNRSVPFVFGRSMQLCCRKWAEDPISASWHTEENLSSLHHREGRRLDPRTKTLQTRSTFLLAAVIANLVHKRPFLKLNHKNIGINHCIYWTRGPGRHFVRDFCDTCKKAGDRSSSGHLCRDKIKENCKRLLLAAGQFHGQNEPPACWQD